MRSTSSATLEFPEDTLYRYIKASSDYKKVVKTVIGDAVCFHRIKNSLYRYIKRAATTRKW